MKFQVIEPLRHNGKTHRPPAEVALDVEKDAQEIERLVRAGVIRAGDTSSKDTQPPQDGDGNGASSDGSASTGDGDGNNTSSDGTQPTGDGGSNDTSGAPDTTEASGENQTKATPKKAPARKASPKKKPATKPAPAAKD
ncbi:MAG: hypothetical protein CMO06_09615 [Thalassospira sp.]|uniref:hypothetical protein n=1 Tax=Thalassospira sp. TaxID=1912094 RepID=UPI000C400C0B|nr:hypothetical protein [Thalassospira sp.]MAZ33388.1 hypothetical protein [Thalassospira sp.]